MRSFTNLICCRSLLVLAMMLFIGATIGCRPTDTNQTTTKNTDDASADLSKLVIVTTTGMITDITQQIAGERATVTGLINSGIDPHLFQPTRNDIQTLMNADVVFYNGLLLEGKMTDALVRVASTSKVVAVTEQIDESSLLAPEDFMGHHDPHVWMDPIAWMSAVDVVTQSLVEFDPQGSEIYESNSSALKSDIESLHNYGVSILETIPQSQRILVTAHDAFNYFGQRYGFEVVGIQGISTESEAGVRDIERIVDLLVTNKINAVFVETTVSDRNINALIAGAKDQGHDVKIGGSLYSDAMGDSSRYEGTYIGMIDHNVTTITRALGGSAPERGMNEKLSDE
jgi:manganese/zinc/iron transport system substrate-binding protein